MRPLLFGFAVGLAAVGIARVASAAPSAKLVYLRAPGAEACPDERAMRLLVAARLGYDPFFPYADNTVIAEIASEHGVLVGRFKLVDAKSNIVGSREIKRSGTGCEELATALALTISIAVDPLSLTRPPGQAPDPEPPPPAPPEVPPPPPAEPDAPPPAPPPVSRPPAARARWLVGVGAHAAVAVAPNVTAGGELFGAVRVASFSAELGARADLPASTERAGGQVSSRILVGTAAAYAHVGPVFGGPLVLLGALHAGGDLATSRDADALYAAAGARLGLELEVAPRVELRVPLDVLATLTRQKLQVDGQDVFQVAPVSLSVGFGAGYTF